MPRWEVTLLQERLKPNSKGRGNSMQNYRYTQKLKHTHKRNEVWVKLALAERAGSAALQGRRAGATGPIVHNKWQLPGVLSHFLFHRGKMSLNRIMANRFFITFVSKKSLSKMTD